MEVVEVVELLISEVVTNAILHTSSPPELKIEVRPDCVRVEVRDTDPQLRARVRSTEDPTATSGRGLAIVDRLATAWGIETKPGVSKVVWFEVAIGRS